MASYIEIAGRKIGADFPPLVIAEIGINHEGSLQIAKEMVDAAQRAGVEVVKHQTHIVEDEMTGAAKKVIPGNADVSIYEIMERCSLNETDELELKNYVESKGMIFISTPFSRAAAERLKKFDIPAYKIGSGECNNYPLLEHIASFGKPVILSTGMNTIESIQKAVAIFDKHNIPVALLHTTNLYPTPIHLVRFGAMVELHEAFPDKVFGLSDHTLNNNACLGAVALGASILERHFTDHMQRTGPDIVCSMDENACQNLIVSSAEIAMMRGGSKKPAFEEQVTIDFAFATVCSIQSIKKGEQLSKENIWVKRPGTGKILAEHFNDLIGKIATRDILNDEQLDFRILNNSTKKILFLTGTRADFGKIKSLIQTLEKQGKFEVFVFVTGMHLQELYGYTLIEIERCNFKNVFTFENHTHETTMDLTLAKTIEGLSNYCKTITPDMIIVHGDRVETLAGAIVGSLNNILVAHIEGGEVSGTVDELIRHSVSKLSHIHFVSNQQASKRVIQMGEIKESVFTIGSPDIDIMFSDKLPDLETAKEYYKIPFDKYAIVMFHPVTTEINLMKQHAENFVSSLLNDNHNYIVIFPNNDLGSQYILEAYEKIRENARFRIFPSLRFEYFLTLLKNSQFIIGNSSAGIREAPYYGIPIINIGTRQQNRAIHADIINVDYSKESIMEALEMIDSHKIQNVEDDFGQGNSAELFLECLQKSDIWHLNHQKQFRDS